MKKTWKGSILKLFLTRRAFRAVVFKLRAEGDGFLYLLNQRKRCLKLNLINLTEFFCGGLKSYAKWKVTSIKLSLWFVLFIYQINNLKGMRKWNQFREEADISFQQKKLLVLGVWLLVLDLVPNE